MRAIQIVFYLLLAVCLIGGLLTGERVFFIVFFAQLGVLILSVALNLWTILRFSFIQSVDREEAVKGDTINLTLSIHNDMPYPFTMMRVYMDAISEGEHTSYAFHLAPRESITFSPQLHCAYRGRFKVGMTYVDIQDVFGLTGLHFDMRKLSYYRQREVLVFPRVHDLYSLPSHSLDEKNFDGTNLRLINNGDSFAGVREYQPGDPLKRIHWKASASKNKLYTRLYEQSSQTDCLVCVDNRTCGQKGEQALMCEDTLCEAASTILYYALSHAHVVHLDTVMGDNLMDAESVRDFPKINRWLALVDFYDQSDEVNILAALAHGQNNGALYLLTMGDCQQMCDRIACENLPFETITVVGVNMARPKVTKTGERVRFIALAPGDDVAKMLEESL
ncbi:DUF58 domain-containing protein [Acetanaerobacterium elongatum]|uniref:DUF58 domain-containing protein n=1 Tax=Acetanaerobacterium elongatum TaxID=258515 RepID=A0A1H0F6P0_9FIRM|nr:DUF58 domain-containing protein [Acetanaerobacterium elongatum]SDN90212.1 Protein of unknown function DUF58 [Acetanaerobacterium elongatum]